MNMYVSREVAQALKPLVNPGVWNLVEKLFELDNKFFPKIGTTIEVVPLKGEFENLRVRMEYLDSMITLTSFLYGEQEMIDLVLDYELPGRSDLFEQNGWKFNSRGGLFFRTDQVDLVSNQLNFVLLQIREVFVKELMA